MLLNYYNAPGRAIPVGKRVDMRRKNNSNAPQMHTPALMLAPRGTRGKTGGVHKGILNGPIRNNIPARPLRGGSKIGRALMPTISRSGGRGRRFGALG